MGTTASLSLCKSITSVNIKYCKNKISPESQTDKKPFKIFGVPLETLSQQQYMHSGIPFVVQDLVEYLTNFGLEKKGLFRVSGSASKIKTLKEKFDQGEKVNLIEDGDIESAASLLKLYFRELPTSVIPYSQHTEFLNVYQACNKDTDECTRKLKGLLGNLPPSHYSLFKYLCTFLLKVASHSQSNQMTQENLATVFGPSIFHVPFGPTIQGQTIYNSLLLYLLRNFEILFPNSGDNPSLLQQQATNEVR
uniref:Rho-GAP domain-containing protein n=1 Tax=Latimeria chalumnae TaxID=7897 RepID=H2ZT76_LATCH